MVVARATVEARIEHRTWVVFVAKACNSPTKQPHKDQITGFDYQRHKLINTFRNHLCPERWLPCDGHL
jgi:hypothetical protein